MDYRALGELVFFALIGLSVLTLVTSLSFHFVLRPFLEKVLVGGRERGALGDEVTRRLESVERRLIELEGDVDRVRQVQEFERQLGTGTAGEQASDAPAAPPAEAP